MYSHLVAPCFFQTHKITISDACLATPSEGMRRLPFRPRRTLQLQYMPGIRRARVCLFVDKQYFVDNFVNNSAQIISYLSPDRVKSVP
jgi:hypothetical protein